MVDNYIAKITVHNDLDLICNFENIKKSIDANTSRIYNRVKIYSPGHDAADLIFEFNHRENELYLRIYVWGYERSYDVYVSCINGKFYARLPGPYKEQGIELEFIKDNIDQFNNIFDSFNNEKKKNKKFLYNMIYNMSKVVNILNDDMDHLMIVNKLSEKEYKKYLMEYTIC